MIHRTPFFLPLFYPSLTWRIPTLEKELYLTFDDGPSPGPTQFVVETLTKYNALATFFCVGDNIQKFPKTFKMTVNRGHAIGNHTFNHLNGWRTPTQDYLENAHRCNAEIQSQLGNGNVEGKNRPLFRPPYGRISRKQISALEDFRIVMWDVLSVDYNSHLSPQKCLKNTINATRKGSVIVFHDSEKAEKNLTQVLPKFLEHFSSLGFAFKALEN